MPKIRGVKPDLWTDENFVELSPFARLLWVGLWNFACDNGHVQDKSKQIKMRVLPTDDVNCAELLREIEAEKLIERADGWITIPNLTHHQKPHKRWYVTCEKPGCALPEGASYGYSKRESTVEQPLANGGSTADVDVDVDVDGDGEKEQADSESLTDEPTTQARKRAATTKRTRLPNDFIPNDANRRIAAERGLDLRRVFEQFADHHAAKGSLMADWHRAFNTWLRKERIGPPTAQKPAESNAQGWLRLANEMGDQENVAPFRQIGGAS